jgi:PilZ domain
MSEPRAESPRDHFRALARRVVNMPAMVENRDGTWPRTARIMDLGLGGACMELLEVVPPGAPVRLLIEAPHLWDPLALDAQIAWLRVVEGGALVGVRFEHQSGTTLRTLTELLEAEAYG